MFHDSNIVKKYSSARTKVKSLITGVLATHSLTSTLKEIKSEDVYFYGIGTDASNHKAIKLFPLVVQYFSASQGLQYKLLKVGSLPNETSDTISEFCENVIDACNLEKRNCVAFCGDNWNTNFGGVKRRGKKNVFEKLRTKINPDIQGIGCPAHILHNCIQSGSVLLNCDLEVIVFKIYSYFSIYTVRNEKLKGFCNFVETEYKVLLSHSKTRWLSLFPCVERILKMFDALKSYFLSIEKAPKVLLEFFQNPLSEAYLYFLHSQLAVFDANIRKIEKAKNSIVEIISILNETMESLESRKEEQFLSLSVGTQLKREDVNRTMRAKFKSEVKEFYDACIEYLSLWTSAFTELRVFSWMTLTKIPEWSELENMCIYLKEKKVEIDDSQLFEEFRNLKAYQEEAGKTKNGIQNQLMKNGFIIFSLRLMKVHCLHNY